MRHDEEKPQDVLSPENEGNLETKNVSSERERTIAEFKEYAKKHQADIENRLRQGDSLDNIFYYDFYNANVDALKYQDKDSRTQELEKAYSEEVGSAQKNLYLKSKTNQKLAVVDAGYWLDCAVNGGLTSMEAVGRLYLNLKPESVGRFFERAVETFLNAGLHVRMKIPTGGNVETFNRLDKMVVYFDAGEEKKFLRVLEGLYDDNRTVFDETGIPRFAAEVKNTRGESMRGVGFGEEPERHRSFGQVRAGILAEVYEEAKSANLAAFDPRFDFVSVFSKECKMQGIDPQNPAFNLSDERGKFSELKRRTGGGV